MATRAEVDRTTIELTKKIDNLTDELDKLKKEKKQKLLQFETLEGLVTKAQNEAKDYKKKYSDLTNEVFSFSSFCFSFSFLLCHMS